MGERGLGETACFEFVRLGLTLRPALGQEVWVRTPVEELDLFRGEEGAFGWEGLEACLRGIGHKTLLCCVHRLTYRY